MALAEKLQYLSKLLSLSACQIADKTLMKTTSNKLMAKQNEILNIQCQNWLRIKAQQMRKNNQSEAVNCIAK